MKVFLDSSALAKRYIQEKGSEQVDRILKKASSLGLSILCLPEVVSALCRRKREATINREQYMLAKQALLNDARDAQIINIIPKIVGRTVELLEKEELRAFDAIHISSAVEWRADLFVSSDKKQLKAASQAGLKTEGV